MRITLLASSVLASTLSLTAQATNGYLVDSNTDELFLVDVTTGAATLIGSTANNGLGTPADLTWRTTTQELWTIDLSGGEVGTIDVTNGTFTPVYQTGLSGWQGMAWDETTQLFYLANQTDDNYTLDPATGITTLLGNSTFGLITCLDTDANGSLFGIDFFSGDCVSIDKTTGIATSLAVTITGFQGLGIDQATGTWLGSNTNDDSLHAVDPTTGINTLIGSHGAGVQFGKGFDLIETGANFATAVRFGDGCNERFASFYESHTAFDLSNTSLLLTNTGAGFVGIAGVTPIATPTAAPTAMGDDVVVQFPLGWTLPYPGGTTTDLWVSSNGFLNLTTNAASGCCSFNVNTLLTNGPSFAAKWRDLNPAAGGTVTFETDPVGQTATVTFDMVPDFGSTSNLNTFQYAFDGAGNVDLRFGTCAATAGGTGWSPGLGNANPGSIDISALPVFLVAGADEQPLALNAVGRPVIGGSMNLVINNVPAGSAIAAHIFGLTQMNPGMSLASIGMPDCFQFCSQDSVALTIAPGASATNVFSVPNDPGLAGVHIQAQGAIFNPGGGHNALEALSSNGIDLGLDIN